ncbi:hypothetical protein FLONG3_4412 [Fusarium longipes]|uniref:Uncharacterized protein n=1 Tax=Fusarium longipes TaxID=694270 RepID=A0A395SYD9_9HYPO|nr:hypothetical protein FLONG3_4412 [Fusarium longipes]
MSDIAERVLAIVAENNKLRGTVASLNSKINTLQDICASQNTENDELRTKNEALNKIIRDTGKAYDKPLEEKNYKILDLNERINKWEAECDSYKKKLDQLEKENEELKAKRDSDNQRLCAVETGLLHRNMQINKLIAILRRKITTHRVVRVALKAAFKLLPDLKQQTTFEGIVEHSKKVDHRALVEKEVSATLIEAGLVVGSNNLVLPTPTRAAEEEEEN